MSATLHLADLVAYALFDIDPNVRDGARVPLHVFLVSVALLETGEPLNDGQLRSAVCSLLPVEQTIGEADIQEAISEVRRTQLIQAQVRLTDQRDAFYEHMHAAVNAAGATDIDEATLRELLEASLQTLFHEQSVALAAAYGADGAGLDAAIAGLNTQDRLREVAAKLAPRAAGASKLLQEAVAGGLEQGLRTLPEPAQAYLAALYHRIVAAAILKQDPTVRRVKHQLAARRVAYLDANVVLSWMFPADGSHVLAQQVFELSRAVGAELRVTDSTLREIAAKIQAARRDYPKFRGEEHLLEQMEDLVLRDYWRAKQRQPTLAWGAFIGAYNPPNQWLAQAGVLFDEQLDLDPVIAGKLPDVEAVLRHVKPDSPTRQIETDARNLLHIEQRRAQLDRDEMGSRVWLVTNDTRLVSADRTLSRAGRTDAPITRHAQLWCDLLAPCVPPDAERASHYVTHLVQSHFGLLAEDPLFVKKQFLEVLGDSRLPLSLLLKDDRLATQILTQLGEDDELQEYMEQRETHKEEWNDHLADAVQRTLNEIQASRTSLKDVEAARRAQVIAEQRAERERRQRDEMARELAAIRQKLKSLEEERAHRGFWRRLLRG